MKHSYHLRLILLALLVLFIDRAFGVHVIFVAFFLWWLSRAEYYGEYGVLLLISLIHDVQYQLPLGVSGVVMFGLHYLTNNIFRKIMSPTLSGGVTILLSISLLFFIGNL